MNEERRGRGDKWVQRCAGGAFRGHNESAGPVGFLVSCAPNTGREGEAAEVDPEPLQDNQTVPARKGSGLICRFGPANQERKKEKQSRDPRIHFKHTAKRQNPRDLHLHNASLAM